MFRRLNAILILLFFPIFLFGQNSLPIDFQENFKRLAVLLEQENVSPIEIAEGSYVATQFFSVGPSGLPPMQHNFSRAQNMGEASVSGLYVVLYGKQKEIESVRQELETQRSKRVWIYELVGTEENYVYALENSKQWKPMLRLLPSTVGCRALVSQCLQSRDPLVRRAGLYWGSFFPNAAFQSNVQQCALDDPDPLTRQMARLLAVNQHS